MYAAGGNDASVGGASAFDGTADGLYKTTDGGSTWTKLGFENRRIMHMQIDPDNPNVILAGYDENGYYSRTAISADGGASWRNLKVRAPNEELRDNTEDYADLNTRSTFIIDGILYAGNAEGLLYRGGNLGLTPMEQILVMPTSITWIFKGSVYAATGAGLYALNLAEIPIVRAYEGTKIKVYNFPNPFNARTGGGTVIRASFPSTVRSLKLKVYSLAGDLVTQSSFNNVTGAYSYAFIWDGKNQEAKRCAPGLYFLVADADGTKVRHKIVLVR